MTYRDETLVLRERLLALESERARLEGPRHGLEIAIAEAEEAANAAHEKLLVLPRRAHAKRATARTLGFILGTLGTVALVTGLFAGGVLTCGEILGLDREAFTGRLERTTRSDVRTGAACTVDSTEIEDQEERCLVEVRCSVTTLHRGEASCGEVNDAFEAVSHEGRGVSDVVVAPRLGLAIVRNAEGVSVIGLDPE
jgi:hypothetical protein